MTGRQAGLRFDIYERVHLSDELAGIKEMDEIELLPQIQVRTEGDQAILQGNLWLTGRYVGEEGDFLNTLEHFIPVEITLPMNRVNRIEEVAVEIENFDFDLLSSRSLNVTGVLSLFGIELTSSEPGEWREEEEVTFVHEAQEYGDLSPGANRTPEWEARIEREPSESVARSMETAEWEQRSWSPPEQEAGSAPTAWEQQDGSGPSEQEAWNTQTTWEQQSRSGSPEQEVWNAQTTWEPQSRSVSPEQEAWNGQTVWEQQERSVPSELEAVEQGQRSVTGWNDSATVPEAFGRSPASEPPAVEEVDREARSIDPVERPQPFSVAQTLSSSAGRPVENARSTAPAKPETPLKQNETPEPLSHEEAPQAEVSSIAASAGVLDEEATYEAEVSRVPEQAAAPEEEKKELKIGFAGKATSEFEHIRHLKSIAANSEARQTQAGNAADTAVPSDPYRETIEWKKLLGASGNETQFRKLRMCIVQKEETIDTIADRYQINPREIVLHNRLGNQSLAEGQVIYIP